MRQAPLIARLQTKHKFSRGVAIANLQLVPGH